MSLKSDVEDLRDETTVALRATHDHFIYTKMLWRIMDVDVRRHKRKFVLRNTVTGSQKSESDFPSIVQASVNDYLPSATIQQLVSLTETFLTELSRKWLMHYPKHLTGPAVEIQDIVDAPDRDAILSLVVDKRILSMGYEGPRKWFETIKKIVSIPHPVPKQIEEFVEFKATRDAFVHNRGKVTQIYLDKVGNMARARLGEFLDLPDSYLDDGFALCQKIITDIGTEAASKA